MSRFRLFDLNPEQESAATHGKGPLLILAGAGTGKTRVITARIAWLIAQGHATSRILAVTFTNKAAKEMKDRVLELIGADDAREVTISTFHSLCVRILRQSAHLLGYKENFSILDESDQSGLLKKIIHRTAAKDETLDPAVARALISKAKNSGWNAPPTEDSLLGAVYLRYQNELKMLNAMDFDDLLVLAVQILRHHPEAATYWQERYEFLLVDEFQDTNRLQLELVSLLAGKAPNVCVVGDDDQSIYSWRGAEVSNILEFERHFPNPVIVKLEQNYRSTPAILGVANRLIRNNVRRRGKNLWSAADEGTPVQVLAMRDDREEAELVTSEISAQRHAQSTPWEHFAVLYRTNQQSRPIEEALRRLKIPYRLIGGKSFFDRREIKDVIAYATCLMNPSNDAAILRILRTPPRGIGAVTVENALSESCNLFAVLQSPEFRNTVSTRTREAISTFCDFIEAFRIRLSTPSSQPAALLQSMLEESGYFEDLRHSCKTQQESLRREENVRDLLRDLDRYQESEGLRTFLDEISLDNDRQDKDKAGIGVTLITLHAAKGLEFPHVYLIGAEDGLLPHQRSKIEGTVDEERRLFYVGITRAMKSLTISHSLQRMKYGKPVACQRSPFLSEIAGDGVVESSGTKILNQPVTAETAENHFARLKQLLAS